MISRMFVFNKSSIGKLVVVVYFLNNKMQYFTSSRLAELKVLFKT